MERKARKKLSIPMVIIAVVLIGAAGALIWKLCQPSYKQSDEPIGATANCGDVFECIEQLETTMSLEEMNALVGSEAEFVRDEDDVKTYRWVFADADDTTIEVHFADYSGEDETNVSFNAYYPDSIVPRKAHLARWEEIQSKMSEEDGIGYDEVVKLVEAEGLISAKSANSKTYRWVDENGKYLSASFDNQTKKCTFVTSDL